MQNICLQLHMETLQHLPLIYRPAFRAALKTRSPSSLPCGIALTSHMRMRRENGYGEMDIYHAEHITVSSFRSIRLHTQTIFQPLFKARLSGDFFFFFFFVIQLPLFIRQELNVSDSHCNSYVLSLVTRMHEPRY